MRDDDSYTSDTPALDLLANFSPNAQRSHAGPAETDAPRDELPGLAGASGWAMWSWQSRQDADYFGLVFITRKVFCRPPLVVAQ